MWTKIIMIKIYAKRMEQMKSVMDYSCQNELITINQSNRSRIHQSKWYVWMFAESIEKALWVWKYGHEIVFKSKSSLIIIEQRYIFIIENSIKKINGKTKIYEKSNCLWSVFNLSFSSVYRTYLDKLPFLLGKCPNNLNRLRSLALVTLLLIII